MKTTNKQLRKTVNIISFVLLVNLLLISCKKEEPTCGCDSETITTIPESTNLIGRLLYKRQYNEYDTYYNNYYWITYIEQNCSNCVHHMIICNNWILNNDFNDVDNLEQGEYVEVKFSGHLKGICNLPTGWPADITYQRITLTSIERQ